jgi:hypothetical protein
VVAFSGRSTPFFFPLFKGAHNMAEIASIDHLTLDSTLDSETGCILQ